VALPLRAEDLPGRDEVRPDVDGQVLQVRHDALDLGRDGAVLLHEGLGPLVVAGALDQEELLEHLLHGLVELVHVHGVADVVVETVHAPLHQVVVHEPRVDRVGLVQAESDHAVEPGQAADGRLVHQLLRQQVQRHELRHQPEAADVALGLLDDRAQVLQGLVHGRLGTVGQRDLTRPHAVGCLVGEVVPEVGLPEVQVPVLLRERQPADRLQADAELRPLEVQVHHDLAAHLAGDRRVVGQLERRHLHAGAGLARQVEHVLRHDGRLLEPLGQVLLVDRQLRRQLRERALDLHQPVGLGLVHHAHARLEGRLPPHEAVVVHFVGRREQHEPAVPGHDPGGVGEGVVVVLERLGLREQEGALAAGVREVRGQAQLARRLLQGRTVEDVVAHGREAKAGRADLLGAHAGVGVLDGHNRLGVQRLQRGLEALLGQVRVVEIRAGEARLAVQVGHEGLVALAPVVAPVVQVDEGAELLVVLGQRAGALAEVAVLQPLGRVLHPEDLVQDVGRGHEVAHQLHVVGRERGQLGVAVHVDHDGDGLELGVPALQLVERGQLDLVHVQAQVARVLLDQRGRELRHGRGGRAHHLLGRRRVLLAGVGEKTQDGQDQHQSPVPHRNLLHEMDCPTPPVTNR